MNIVIQSVHFDASVQLKEFIEKKISKLDKFTDQIVDAEVILKVVKQTLQSLARGLGGFVSVLSGSRIIRVVPFVVLKP